VHVAAPGVKIYSTVRDGKYAAKSGTSMATPHVAGVAALLLSANPEMTYSDVKARLMKTSVPIQGLRKKVAAKGRIDAYNAFNNIIPPSNEPDESLWKTVDQAIESPHPYKDKDDLKFEVKQAGAKYIRVIFEKVDTEEKYDTVSVLDAQGAVVDSVSGKQENYVSEYVQGDSLTVNLKADFSVSGWGFKVSKVQIITE
jgi:subtilisin family serine protease